MHVCIMSSSGDFWAESRNIHNPISTNDTCTCTTMSPAILAHCSVFLRECSSPDTSPLPVLSQFLPVFCAQFLDSSTLRDEPFTSEVCTPPPPAAQGKHKGRHKANGQAIVQHRHGKWHDGVTFTAQCLMTLVLHGQLPHSVDTELKSDQLHDDVNLVHRSYVTDPNITN
jgi:hypothetical protein